MIIDARASDDNHAVQVEDAQISTIFSKSDDEKVDPELRSTDVKIPKDEELFYVDFEPGDRRNPVNFSRRKKWIITVWACFSTFIVSITASAYNMGFPTMTEDLNCSELLASTGLSVYALGFAFVPLVTASLSEEFGRRPLYIYSGIGYILMYVMIALAKNIETVIVGRFLQGSFGSTGATMVGGTIADIWITRERGLPMSLFALCGLTGTGVGPIMAGWVEMNPHLGWRWIQWILMIICAVYLILVPVLMVETRTTIILKKMAQRVRKESGDKRHRAKVEIERPKLRRLIFISCTRPVYLLFTEPVVFGFSLWIGFVWGISFGMIDSFAGVFGTIHNFNIGEIGSVFASMSIGAIFGFLANTYQETLYQKHFSKRGPEARLYSACASSIIFPIGMFIYAWSSFPFVPWIAQAIGVVIYMFAAFTIYLATFSYIADCYGPFASSALAGQSLLRNIFSAAYPLFTTQMFQKLTYKWANTLLGLIGVLMIPIPFALFLYGPAIRKRSKFSRTVMETQA